MRGCCVVAGILHHCTPSAGHLPFDQARTSGGKLCKDASSGPWPSLPPSELWSVHHTPRPKTTPTKTSPAMQLVASTQGKHRPDEWSTSGQQCGRRRSSTRGQRKSTLPIVGAHGGASFHQQLRVSSGQRPREFDPNEHKVFLGRVVSCGNCGEIGRRVRWAFRLRLCFR